MKKAEFVAALSRHGAMSRTDAKNVLLVFRHTLEAELPATGKIALPGIGIFRGGGKTRPQRPGSRHGTGNRHSCKKSYQVQTRQGISR